MIAEGLLPKSCEFNFKVALEYARAAMKETETMAYRDDKQMVRLIDKLGVAIEHLQEIKKKVEVAGK